MKQFKILILLNLTLFLLSCSTIKEGFSSQKKNSSDEFLVEKKSPLVMPPDYKKLPIPEKDNLNNDKEESEIKSLINKTKKDDISSNKLKKLNKTFEDSLLEKIKNN